MINLAKNNPNKIYQNGGNIDYFTQSMIKLPDNLNWCKIGQIYGNILLFPRK